VVAGDPNDDPDAKTRKKMLESIIGGMDHISFVILGAYHFLSHLRSLLACACLEQEDHKYCQQVREGLRIDAIDF
jgi:hypothetical protein